MIRRRRWCLGLILLGLLVQPAPARADVLHVYDRLNRLRATVDPAANDAAVWTFDGVGNITSVTRQPATQTTILEIPPDAVAGACGVRILGIGFSPTPGQNTVTVNGVAATVQSATATELVVCLGGSTTTGPVAVTTPTGSATSAGSLSVQATGGGPTITSVAPTVVAWGTPLSVTGTGFDPEFGRTRVRMGATAMHAPATDVTPTTLGTTVPPGTTSGRLTVRTLTGTATAPSDIFVPPAPYTPADVGVTARVSLGVSQGLTIPAGKQALLVFDGTPGQRVCLGEILTAGPSVETTAYTPPGATLVTPAFYGSPAAVEPPPLPQGGTYTVRLRNGDATGSSVTFTLHDASDQTQGVIPTDGTATSLTFTTPCYRAGRTASGTAGQRWSLLADPSMTGGSVLTFTPPSGSALATLNLATSGTAFLEPVTLVQTGTHTVWVDPNGATTGQVTLRLYDVPADLDTPVTPNGSLITATLSVPGQNARFPFTGTAGHRLGVQIEWSTFGGSVWIAQPDDTVIGPVQVTSPAQSRFFETPALPTSGTHRLVVDPSSSQTGWMALRLYDLVDVTPTVAINGGVVPVTLTAPGQDALAQVANNTAGQLATVRISSNGVGYLFVTLKRPDGSTQATTGSSATSFTMPQQTLATVGTYQVQIDPWLGATGGFSVEVTSP